MNDRCSLTQQSIDRRIWAGNPLAFVGVLGIGVLLGVLAGIPYGRLFGLSNVLRLAVQSMISVFAFAGLLCHWPAEMSIERECLR